jgi:hypothetical protein
MKNSKMMISSDGRHVVEVVGEGEKRVVFVDGVQVEERHDQDQKDRAGKGS